MAQQNKNAVFYATTYHPIQAGSIDGTDTVSHDNGVYRALVASSTGLYDPTGDRKAEGDPYNTLFIGRLARHTTDQTLHEAMSKYGRVQHLRLVRHIVTGASRGYAFVEFENEKYMRNAYELAQHQIIDGSAILVDYNRQQLMPGWIPRRLGGGLGGRKESGQLRFGGRDRPFRAPLRTVPQEELSKLGVPLPSADQYMSRFQLPPTPRPPGSRKESVHHKQNYSHRERQSWEALAVDDRAEKDQRAISSSRSGRRSADEEGGSSSRKRHKSKQDDSREAEQGLSETREVEMHCPRRSHSEHDHEEQRSHDRVGSEGQDGRHERRHSSSSSKAGHRERTHRERAHGHRRRSRSRSRDSHRDSDHRHRKERHEAHDLSP